jgi:hypothetical protein
MDDISLREVYSICPLCDCITYDIPRSTDNVHDSLCCGIILPKGTFCTAENGQPCAYHYETQVIDFQIP